MRKTMLTLCMAFAMTGCATNGGSDVFSNRTLITLGSGAAGALACNQIFKDNGNRAAWTAACGAGGYFVSRAFTRNTNEVLERNQTGQTSMWQDPDGREVTFTPTNTYYAVNNRPCRDYHTSIEVDGRLERINGTACRKADGSWETMQAEPNSNFINSEESRRLYGGNTPQNR